MYIKLLCINTSDMCDFCGDKISTVKEGDVIKALIDESGVCFEYKPNCYTMPYSYEDIAKNFISAFDEESYNKIYKKENNCKMFSDNEEVAGFGGVTIKINYE